MKKQSKLACTLLILCTTFAWTGCSDDDNPIRNTPTEDPTPAEPANPDPHAGHRAEGFWIVNEDWFGHDNGTVNRFKRTGYTTLEPVYRAYRAANDGETFGVTTQFGAIWGDNFYFTSKQGNRLVVANARTLKRKAVFTEIGGDGRAFVGLTDRKAYVGHNRGVAVFDIPSLTITRQLEGISSQTGDMRLAAGKVFVVTQKEGLCVVDADGKEVLRLPLKGDNGLGSEWSTVNKQENWDDKYFWFPALPVFEDACKPEFTADNMGLTAGHSGEFDLNYYVKDDDNMPLDMQFSVQTPADFPAKLTVDGHRLKVEAGSRKGTFTFTLVVLSNGVRAEKEMKLNVG